MKRACLMFFLLQNIMVLYAQYNDPYQYYPMKTGNYWYYSAGPPGYYYSQKVFADSTDSAGNRFFWMSTKYPGARPLYGIDTNHFFIVKPTSESNAKDYYKLDAEIGEWWWVWRGDLSDTTTGDWCEVTSIYDGYYLGMETRFKVYAFNIRIRDNDEYHDYWDHNVILAYGIGMVYQDNDAYYPYNLLGAIIDGKVIGNPVGVEETTFEELPGNFELYQNYPNPFNPSSVISYQLPVAGHIVLRVFDILGREIETLVNEEKQAGKYKVKFDGSGLASGIYFYQLITNKTTRTMKMILQK